MTTQDLLQHQLEETEERIAEAHAWGASNADAMLAMRRERTAPVLCQHCHGELTEDEAATSRIMGDGPECDGCWVRR
jgi:hypothetical protein